MADKQIIDEERMFECVWCKYGFKESDANFILSENPNECVCSGCITEWADNLLCDLKRKEQECKKLKSQIEIYSNMLESSSNKILKKEEECEELKAYAQAQENQRETYYKEFLRKDKALDEIKKVCLEDTRTFADGTEVRYDSLDKILDIISRAKGEGND